MADGVWVIDFNFYFWSGKSERPSPSKVVLAFSPSTEAQGKFKDSQGYI